MTHFYEASKPIILYVAKTPNYPDVLGWVHDEWVGWRKELVAFVISMYLWEVPVRKSQEFEDSSHEVVQDYYFSIFWNKFHKVI